MFKTVLIAAALALPAPAFASEWMGSLNFTKNGSGSSTWTASLKDGEGKMKTNFGKFDVQRSNSFFIISSKNTGIVGTGIVTNGHVAGTFSYRQFGGDFMGDRTSKSNSKGGKGKK